MFHPGSYPGTSPGEKAIETGDHRGRRYGGLFVKSPLHFFLPFVFSSPGTEGAGMKEPFMEWKSKKATQLQASWRRLQKECGAQLIKWWRQQSHSWLCGPGVLQAGLELSSPHPDNFAISPRCRAASRHFQGVSGLCLEIVKKNHCRFTHLKSRSSHSRFFPCPVVKGGV